MNRDKRKWYDRRREKIMFQAKNDINNLMKKKIWYYRKEEKKDIYENYVSHYKLNISRSNLNNIIVTTILTLSLNFEVSNSCFLSFFLLGSKYI